MSPNRDYAEPKKKPKKERKENWNVEERGSSNFRTSKKAIQVFNSNTGFFLWPLKSDPFDIS